ncbi:MAG: MFS transporter [Acidobacteriota bacterium]|nr:MFS transporter [Acidobacteriota bacterium]
MTVGGPARVSGPGDGGISTCPLDADPRRWLALTVMCFTVLLISLDGTVLNVALPTLVTDLHPSASGVQWIAAGFVLTEAVLLLMGGALGDRLGRRRVFLAGVAVFGLSSLGCALVHSAGLLILTRCLTGLGAALLMPATLAIIATTFPVWERSRAIGIWAGVSGIGTAAGPLIGGFLLHNFWWGSVFIINVPVAAAGIIGGVFFVSESKAPDPAPLDPTGVTLSALGLAGITYGLIMAPDDGWTSASTVGSMIAGSVLLGIFVVYDRRRARPMVDFHLFRNPTFSTGLAAVAAAMFAMFGVSFLLSQYIQFVQGASVFSVGLRFLPMAAGTLVGSNVATRLATRFGLRAVITAGMLLVSAALGIYTTLGVTSDPLPVAVAFTLVGSGMGLVMAPASNAVMSTLPPDKIGLGSGLRTTVQLLSGSFGVAIIGNVAISRYRSGVSSALAGPLRQLPRSARDAIYSQIGSATAVASRLPDPSAARVRALADSAYVRGIRLGALVDVTVLLLAVVAVARYIPSSRPSMAVAVSAETAI